MVELTEAEYRDATRQGAIDMATAPRAREARYDQCADRVVVDLANGTTFTFPPHLLQGFGNATPEQISKVELSGAGFGLHWDDLDADFTVAGLLAGRFGSARYMIERFGPDWDVAAAE